MTSPCPSCDGSGSEWIKREGGEWVKRNDDEVDRRYVAPVGPCSACEGSGERPPETPAP